MTGRDVRRSFALVLAAAAALGTAAAEGTEDSSLEPVTLMLDWVPNVNHVGLFVAAEMGFFREEGLDVTIVQSGEVYAAGAVMGGQADFAVDFQENVTLLRASGVPVISIAALVQTNTSGFAVRASDGITTPSDFDQLVYGTFNSPFEEPTLSALVRCSGGNPTGIRYVTAGSDLLVLLQQGLADIVWIYYATQGFQAERIGFDIGYFPLNEYTDCIPDYYTPILISSEDVLERRPDTTAKFLAALTAAHEFVADAPLDAARVLAEAVPELDGEELAKSVPWLAERMFADDRWGFQEQSVWAAYADWMRSVGVLEGAFDAGAAFTTEYLPPR
jgi:ABC-type nitrate/sulfonate/bicarbonate transport system substrate-binding protein